MLKQYLGDSVYVELYRDGLTLTTENDGAVSNRIYLEPEVVAELIWYIKAAEREQGEE